MSQNFILGFGRLLFVFVLLLIVFNGYCTQYFVIFPWLGPSLETHVRLLPLNLLLVMVWVTYYLAIATDPGRVPPWYEPSETSAGKAGLRWCRKCKVFKPPRTHHCSVCQRCVLKMDHHCPWTLNCIGARNHAYFLRFLFYTVLADGIVLMFLGKRIYSIYEIAHLSSIHGPTTKEIVFLLCTTFSSFLTLILISVLLGYQLWQVLENTTTIEALEKQRVERWVEKHKASEVEFPYDISWSRNLSVVFGGTQPLLWFWPWNVTKHDGLDYPTLEGVELPWPPLHTIPEQDFAPPTSELPWSSSRQYKHETVSRLRRPPPPDEESGESEIESSDEGDGDFFDGWFGMEDMEDYGVDVENEVRGLRSEEEGVVWEEVLRRRREEE